jgi:hypothetical protein
MCQGAQADIRLQSHALMFGTDLPLSAPRPLQRYLLVGLPRVNGTVGNWLVLSACRLVERMY